MNVASLELCTELYELSGWEASDWYDIDTENGEPEEYLLTYEDVTVGYCGQIRPLTVPAYNLGYLLQKLPRMNEEYWLTIQPVVYPQWCASYDRNDGISTKLENFGDTPEDAAAKLAIELFKQGILTRDGDE